MNGRAKEKYTVSSAKAVQWWFWVITVKADRRGQRLHATGASSAYGRHAPMMKSAEEPPGR